MAKTSAAAAVAPSICCRYIMLLAFLAGGLPAAAADNFETTVSRLVNETIYKYPATGPGLIRLLFHDCWVNGCDGSVLLDWAPYNSSRGTEKNASGNFGLNGLDLINEIKANISNTANDASCADILAYAAREAVKILSGGRITYNLTRGRTDGVNSSATYADSMLPGSNFSFDQLKKNFADKGYSVDELVALSGAHAVGVCHYSSFADRFSNLSTAGQMATGYKAQLLADILRQKTSGVANPIEKNNIRDMSDVFRNASGYDADEVNTAATGVLDNSYYTANLQNMVLLTSDWALTTNDNATHRMNAYKNNSIQWNKDFGEAMRKLSSLTLPAGQKFDTMRNNCSVTNHNYY